VSEPALTSPANVALDTPNDAATDAAAAAAADKRRWLILGVVAIAQLMIILDSAIMNIALPSAANGGCAMSPPISSRYLDDQRCANHPWRQAILTLLRRQAILTL